MLSLEQLEQMEQLEQLEHLEQVEQLEHLEQVVTGLSSAWDARKCLSLRKKTRGHLRHQETLSR
jgi:hypothetical protein